MKTNILLTKPLTKMPKELIYKSVVSNVYRLIKLKAPAKQVGYMAVNKHLNKREKLLEIDFICTNPQSKGYGDKLIKFAKNLCIKEYDGIILQADRTIYNKKKAAHTFYRKNGFYSLNPFLNIILDLFLKTKGYLPCSISKPTIMYYKPDEKKSFFEKIISKI